MPSKEMQSASNLTISYCIQSTQYQTFLKTEEDIINNRNGLINTTIYILGSKAVGVRSEINNVIIYCNDIL